MKKLFALFLALLLLCSCGVQEEPIIEEPQSEAEVSESSEDEPSEDDSMIGKDHSSELVIREVTEGTRMTVRGNIHGMTPANVYVEIPNELYYIEFKDGTPAINHPVETYVDYCYDNLENVSPEIWKHCCVIECSYNGDSYRYEKNEDGVYELLWKYEKSKEEFGEYIKTAQYFTYGFRGVGLEDKEGNIILEPIYCQITNVFGNKIAVFEGTMQAADAVREYLYDENFNLLTSEFNYIADYIYGDTYIGVAYCFGEKADVICYDENGKVCEEGIWLVDINGNKISEKFKQISFNNFDGTTITPETEILVIFEDGTTSSFLVGNYFS